MVPCRHIALTLLFFGVLVGTARSDDALRNCPPQAQVPSAQRVQAAMRNAVDRGFLWRIEKDARVSYLFGTVHVAKFDWMFPGPAVHAALVSSDTVALELDMLDADIHRGLEAAMAADHDVPLGKEVAARLQRQARSACVDDAGRRKAWRCSTKA